VRARGDKTVFPRGPWAEPRVEWREVKGGLGCFSAPKAAYERGSGETPYLLLRTNRLFEYHFYPSMSAFLK
jgi:hypothetical protein